MDTKRKARMTPQQLRDMYELTDRNRQCAMVAFILLVSIGLGIKNASEWALVGGLLFLCVCAVVAAVVYCRWVLRSERKRK